jgi:hypothetical protein
MFMNGLFRIADAEIIEAGRSLPKWSWVNIRCCGRKISLGPGHPGSLFLIFFEIYILKFQKIQKKKILDVDHNVLYGLAKS